jgi:hypothetical protein
MFSAFTITPFIASHANTSQTHWCTVLYLYSKIGIQSPILFIPLQSINDVAHTSLTALRMEKKPCGLSPTDPMLMILPEVMKTPGGWQEGR